jgi:hypothetical protein
VAFERYSGDAGYDHDFFWAATAVEKYSGTGTSAGDLAYLELDMLVSATVCYQDSAICFEEANMAQILRWLWSTTCYFWTIL